MPQITTRDAVTRALAAMEIAESCSHPEIRNSFTSLAESWLEHAADSERSLDGPDEGEAPATA